MAEEASEDITGRLDAWNNGDEEALSHLVAFLYPELRRMSRQHLDRCQPGHTLESAALANEAYLKLLRTGGIRCENRVHFLALCSQMIRRILVDHARGRGYAKRGGNAVHVPLDEALLGARARGIELLALDEALSSLSRIDARKGRVVELRYFGGLSVEETSEVMGISPKTVNRDWKMAKAWLFAALTAQQGPPQILTAGVRARWVRGQGRFALSGKGCSVKSKTWHLKMPAQRCFALIRWQGRTVAIPFRVDYH